MIQAVLSPSTSSSQIFLPRLVSYHPSNITIVSISVSFTLQLSLLPTYLHDLLSHFFHTVSEWMNIFKKKNTAVFHEGNWPVWWTAPAYLVLILYNYINLKFKNYFNVNIKIFFKKHTQKYKGKNPFPILHLGIHRSW